MAATGGDFGAWLGAPEPLGAAESLSAVPGAGVPGAGVLGAGVPGAGVPTVGELEVGLTATGTVVFVSQPAKERQTISTGNSINVLIGSPFHERENKNSSQFHRYMIRETIRPGEQ